MQKILWLQETKIWNELYKSQVKWGNIRFLYSKTLKIRTSIVQNTH